MLRLILDRAKTGKTKKIMGEIRARVEKKEGFSVLLVPEQYSHEAETELLRECGDSLSLYGEVLSFTRLYSRVAEELPGMPRTVLDRSSRRLCLLLALDQCCNTLQVFGGAQRDIPLQGELLKTFDELKTCGVGPEDLKKAAYGKSGFSAGKFNDLAKLYDVYNGIVKNSGIEPLDRPDILAERLEDLAAKQQLQKSRYTRAAFYVDGFTDFTAQENKVLLALLKCGAEVTVCLTCDGEKESLDVFQPSLQAAENLKTLCEKNGISYTVAEHASEAQDPERRGSCAAFLEQHLFSFENATKKNDGFLSVRRAETIAAECEYAAAECIRLVRETKCRWRDIAVAARNYAQYSTMLENTFTHYAVPFYAAAKHSLAAHPLSVLISSAYRIGETGWGTDEVLSYLRTGLTGLSTEACDLLADYLFLHSMRGNSWTNEADWVMNPDGFSGEIKEEQREKLLQINVLRRRVAAPLSAFFKQNENAATVGDYVRALSGLLQALEMETQLLGRGEKLRALGMAREAAEYAQVWELTEKTLEDCERIAGSLPIETDAFGSLFAALLSAQEIGTVPLTLDRISIGSMERMRRRNIKHLIVLGCDSDSMPKISETGGILSDSDREVLIDAGFAVGETAPSRLYREFALIYNCLTLADTSLSLSFCGSSSVKPCFAVERAKALFGAEETTVDLDACRINALQPAKELASAGYGLSPTAAQLAARRFLEEEGTPISIPTTWDRGQLSSGAVSRLYGDTPAFSASRIETFSKCPYKFFMEFGLKAKAKEAAEFTPAEYGIFLHDILEHVLRELNETGFRDVEEEQVEALCEKYTAQYAEEKLQGLAGKSERFLYLFDRLKDTVCTVVKDAVAELAAGDFRPLDFELNFANRDLFPPTLLGDGESRLVLTGIADRVDGWEQDGKLYIRVMDYKTGNKKFRLNDVKDGISLQMLLYLYALQKHGKARYGKEIVPAGILYVPAKDSPVSTDGESAAAAAAQEHEKNRRRSGLLLDDPAVIDAMEHAELPKYLPVKVKKDGSLSGDALASGKQLEDLRVYLDGKLCGISAALHSGMIDALPYFHSDSENACIFCDYADVCRHSPETDGVKQSESKKIAELWAEISRAANGKETETV